MEEVVGLDDKSFDALELLRGRIVEDMEVSSKHLRLVTHDGKVIYVFGDNLNVRYIVG